MTVKDLPSRLRSWLRKAKAAGTREGAREEGREMVTQERRGGKESGKGGEGGEVKGARICRKVTAEAYPPYKYIKLSTMRSILALHCYLSQYPPCSPFSPAS